MTAATDRLRASAARRSPTARAAGPSSRRAPTPLVPVPALSGIPTSGLPSLSRAAVTDATSSRRLDPEQACPDAGVRPRDLRWSLVRPNESRGHALCGEWVDGERGSQSPLVCGSGAARLADIPAAVAVSAPHAANTPGTLTPLSSLTPPSPALAPGLSPRPSRLTPLGSSPRPDESALLGRDRLTLPRSRPCGSDAARIAAPCSAPSTPAAREGGTRSGAASRAAVTAAARRGGSTPCGLTASAAHNRPRSAGDGVRPADAPASSDASHTESAEAFATDAALRRQELPLAPAGTSQVPAGLIEQSTRPDGDGFPPVSLRSSQSDRQQCRQVPTQGRDQ